MSVGPVVIIGAGPAGSAAAAHLGAAGVDTLLLERASSTGGSDHGLALTPSAVAELDALGLPTDGWHRTTGVRFVGGGMRLALAWPDVDGRAAHGLVRSRSELARDLSSYAVTCGAQVRFGAAVTGFTTDAGGRVSGVRVGDESIDAAFVLDASGVDAVMTGTKSGSDAVMRGTKSGAVAVTADFESPRATDDHLESWLRLTDADGATLPGHGWIVGRGDGRVTVGVGALAQDTSATPDACAAVLQRWLTALPANWQLGVDTMTGPISGSRLATEATQSVGPDGVIRIGDAAGVESPWTGEGLTSALVSARLAATAVVDALTHDTDAGREGALTAYAHAVRTELGSHDRLAAVATGLLERPAVARAVTTWAFPREALMKFALRRLAPARPTAVETCVTTSTMGRVTRDAAHPGTERGVDQR